MPTESATMSDNIECRTFKTCFQKLVYGISNPSFLAVSLYSKDIISAVVRDEVISIILPPADRTLKLLTAVECQINVDRNVFHSFLKALREDRSLIYLADSIVEAHHDEAYRE